MRHKWNFNVVLIAFGLFSATCVRATNTTTPAQKVNVKDSVICKKCACDVDYKQLNCTNKGLTDWFSKEEWSILQNGDIIFETIKMDHNNLTTIPKLPAYPVKNLIVAFNQIVNISIDAFQNLTELTKLDLSYNKLLSKALVPDIFRGTYSPADYLPLDKMRELNLGGNLLHTLDSDLFEHLPKLESLILCKNTFHVIDHQAEIAIAGLTSLKTLDLSYMELDDLPDDLLHGPRDLETLILTGNLLDEIPDNMERAINLKELVLDENPMGDFVDENVFPTLISLEFLSISYLPELTKIGKNALSNLQNLTTLIIASNPKLSYIDANALAKDTLNPEIFDYPPLKNLYLHNNNLTLLERELVQRWDKIETIDLRFNPWACDCTNSWLIHTLMTQINQSKPLLTHEVNCATPQAWKDVRLIELHVQQKNLICENANNPGSDGVIIAGLLVGILIGIPLTIGGMILYRRGCFGLFNRRNQGGHALYNRASFNEDFHI